jgi:hypothetical protein
LDQNSDQADVYVRFGSKADIHPLIENVRFGPIDGVIGRQLADS